LLIALQRALELRMLEYLASRHRPTRKQQQQWLPRRSPVAPPHWWEVADELDFAVAPPPPN
jgi:hypothetical protein